MIEVINTIVKKHVNTNSTLNIELIQELWSGYGQLCRVKYEDKSVIVKLINLYDPKKHPRGWNSNLSHRRKVKSYEVETNWYTKYNLNNPRAKTAKLIASGKEEKYQFIILEDLEKLNFLNKNQYSNIEIKLCISWLAQFHAQYINYDTHSLWEIGTYWHLATRPDEFKEMQDVQLKQAAAKIDATLNSAKFKTIVHGDAKVANFLFSNQSVAAVDFQYVGAGIGMKDLIYFLSSVYSDTELEMNENLILDFYFHELRKALAGKLNEKEISELEKEWHYLYSFAWADFYRFLDGWSPGHYKMNSYTEKMRDKVLNML